MTPVSEMKLVQLLITNRCSMKCTHCSQMCPHVTKEQQFDMTLNEVENALITLRDAPFHIGLFGGEPTLHPQFPEVLGLLRKHVPVKARRELWTNGAMWKKYEGDIKETFYEELIAYNEHEEEQPCWHQPNQIAAEEVFTGWVTQDRDKDEALMWRLIDNCWVQNRWSAAVTPHGAYFCEVAAARAITNGGPKGITVREGWWREPLHTYEFLKNELCVKCSMCLPMEQRPNDKQGYDDISPKLLRKLKKNGSPYANADKCQAFDVTKLQQYYQCHDFEPETDYLKRGLYKDFPEWTPFMYRDYSEKKHKPEDVNHGTDDTGQADKQSKDVLLQPGRASKAKGRKKAK